MSEHPAKRQKTTSDKAPLPKPMEADDSMASTTPSSNGAPPPVPEYEEEENLFPGASNPSSNLVRPHTPQNDNLNASAPGELSPPRSLTQDTRAATNGHYAADDTNVSVAELKQEDTPGAGWRNKKAHEEMQRAWEYAVDRDFSLKEFGDVVAIGKQQRGEA
jgi:hypothetical protein